MPAERNMLEMGDLREAILVSEGGRDPLTAEVV